MSKYHVSLDQIREHTYRNLVMAALYYIGEELENLLKTENREQTDRQTENRQRIQLQSHSYPRGYSG